MLCSLCGKNEAIIVVERVMQSKKQRLGICLDCARENNINQDPDSLQKIFDLFSKQQDSKNVCPVCGASYFNLKKNLIVGCPECYNVFSKQIKDLLKAIGSTAVYTGTMPKKLKGFKSILTDRMLLQEKLEEAVKNEDYEKAALYRDYIKALNSSPLEDASNDA